MAYIDKNIACDLLAKKALEEQQVDECAELTTQECLSIVRAIPTADVEEVKHGKWVEIVKDIGRGRTITHYQCSLCGVYIAQRTNGCPNCIAKMDGGNEE